MNSQHLSEEAVAAFADGVLGGHARDRAARHVEHCAECRQAVRVQREATFALRSAVAPPMPSGLVDRLRSVPLTTPMPAPPSVLAPDGSAVLPTFAPMAAFVESRGIEAGPADSAASPDAVARGRSRPYFTATALVAAVGAVGAAGALVAGAVADGPAGRPGSGPAGPGDVHPVVHRVVHPVGHVLDTTAPDGPAVVFRDQSGHRP